MRAFNRILCVLLAVAIAVAGVLTVIEVIAAATDNDPVIVKWHGLVKDLATNEWKTAAPRVTAIVLILVGLLLLLFALRRGKPATVALSTDAPSVDMTTTRRSLQRSLATTATSVDGITDASVKVKRRTIVVKARAVEGVTREDGSATLSDAMQARLDRLSLAEAKRLKVKVIPEPDKGTPEEPAGLTAPETSAETGTTDREPVDAGGGARRPSGSSAPSSGSSGRPSGSSAPSSGGSARPSGSSGRPSGSSAPSSGSSGRPGGSSGRPGGSSGRSGGSSGRSGGSSGRSGAGSDGPTSSGGTE